MRLPRLLVRLAARLKPVVPDRAWPLLLAGRSFLGQAPVVGQPGFRSVVVLAPHPDDEAVGAGGTIRLLADSGARVTVVFATDGDATIGASEDPSEVARRRRAEAEASCALLGAEPRFLGLPDGSVASEVAALARGLGDAVRTTGAEAVFLPWFADGHPDHDACSRAVGAAGLEPSVEVWGYETWTPLPANRVVDITSAVEAKRRAIAAHATAHQAFDVGAMLGLSRYRSVHGLMGRGYAEAFLAGRLADYLAAAERATSDKG